MFTLDENNSVAQYDSRRTRDRELVRFGSERELAMLAAKWPAARLVAIWNGLSGVTRVRKFTDRKTGVRRIWKAIQDFRSKQTPSLPQGTKAERMIALLRKPSGATLQALMTLTGWQAHSVRGFMSAQISKKRGLQIQSFKRNGARTYRIRP